MGSKRMEPPVACDIDGQTDRSIWAGAHESISIERHRRLKPQIDSPFLQFTRCGGRFKSPASPLAALRITAANGVRAGWKYFPSGVLAVRIKSIP